MKDVLKNTEFADFANQYLFYGKSRDDMQKNEKAIIQKVKDEILREKQAAFHREELISEYVDRNGKVALSRENDTIIYDVQDKDRNITTFKLKYYDHGYHPYDDVPEMRGHHLTVLVNGQEKLYQNVHLSDRLSSQKRDLLSKKEFDVLLAVLKNTEFASIAESRLIYEKLSNDVKFQKENSLARKIDKSNTY